MRKYRWAIPAIGILAACGPQIVVAQEPPRPPGQVAFLPTARGAKVYRLETLEGQAVYLPPGAKREERGAGTIRVTLFHEKDQMPEATTLTGDYGRFQFEKIPPGRYVLVAGADTLQTISIPVQVEESAAGEKGKEVALLLHLRAKEDRRRSFATPITDPALRRELIDRAREDQAIRNEWIKKGVEHPDEAVLARMKEIDAGNLARMREIVQQSGFPGPDRVGVDGAENAFLLIQHATQDFQEEMLPHVQRAYRAGRLSGQSYALLSDRVRVREGKPQVYGTQAKPFGEWKNQEPALFPIEDEANVDKRRAEVGLPPLADYRKMLKQIYFPSK